MLRLQTGWDLLGAAISTSFMSTTLLCCFGSHSFPEQAHKDRKYQGISQYVAEFNKALSCSSSSLAGKCSKSESVVWAQDLFLRVSAVQSQGKEWQLPLLKFCCALMPINKFLCRGSISVACGFPFDQMHWWRPSKHHLNCRTSKCSDISVLPSNVGWAGFLMKLGTLCLETKSDASWTSGRCIGTQYKVMSTLVPSVTWWGCQHSTHLRECKICPTSKRW